MRKTYEINYLRSEVARIIGATIDVRRRSLEVSGEPVASDVDAPPTKDEIDEFLLQCPLEKQELTNTLLGEEQASVELTSDEYNQFLEDVEAWSGVNAWLAGDEWPHVK
ncbi:MAG: hypothetical protein WCD37_15960 [Chloroflexia bacterium]